MEYGQQPDVWAELYVEREGSIEPRVFGMGPYADDPDFHYGWKEPRLLEIGDIERTASNASQQYQAASMMLRFQDTDHLFRNDLFRGLARWPLGMEAITCMEPRVDRFAKTEPTLLMRGILRERATPKGRQAVGVVEDVIGAQFGRYSLDRRLPPLKIEPPDFPNAPKDISGKQSVPLITGPHSDKGTTLESGAVYEKGLIPAYFAGDYDVGDDNSVTPTTVRSFLPLPPAPTYTVVGSPFGGGHTWTFAASVATQYGWTPPGGTLTIADLPSNGDVFPSGSYLVFHLAEYAADLQAQVTAVRLYVKAGAADSTSPWHYVDGFGEAWGTSGTTGFEVGAEREVNPGDSFFKTQNPVPTTNGAVITRTTGGVTLTKYRMFVVAQGYVNITALYASALSGDQTSPDRVLVPLASPDFLRPGSPGWPLPNPWIVINGRRYTVFFGVGPRADLAVTGDLSIAVNVCGYTQDGSDATNMVEGAFDQCVMLLNHFVFANQGDGYQDGNWPALAAYRGSTSVQFVNTESFYRCRDYSIARIGGLGYLGHIYLNRQITLREFLRKFSEAFDCYFYPNRFGQICCGILDENADLGAAIPLRDRIEIMRVGEPVRDDRNIESRLRWVCDYDPDLGQFRRDPVPIEDIDSKTYHGGRWLQDPELHEIDWTRDPITCGDAMLHRSERSGYASTWWPIDVKYGPGLNLEIGDVVSVTNDEYALVEQAMVIWKIKVIPPRKGARAGYVSLTCLDLDVVLGLAGMAEAA